jgi:hypothetical protein
MSMPRYIPLDETAARLRDALEDAHPGVTFAAHRARNADRSIFVTWADGPTDAEVMKIALLYRGDTFLSTDDGAEIVRFDIDTIETRRTLSPRFRDELEQMIADFTGKPFDGSASYSVTAGVSSNDQDAPATLHRSERRSHASELIDRLARSRRRTGRG